ncbi:MAG TPA: arylsulfatase [Bacteroidales bacterium]|nr:arylsulfatase [Bacteroidales bacterium]
MNKLLITTTTCLAAMTSCTMTKKQAAETANKPNIVIIYTDDVGYGDIGVNGAKGVVTPNIDKLAHEGIRFTDAHCSASTCTPSRYSLLTGSYAFRRDAAVLPGDAPLIIDPSKGTLPSMLQTAGYKTAVVGKWHLGLGNGHIDWNSEITPGAREVGFDYSFIIPATPDRVPCVFVENDRVANLDPSDPITVSYKHDLAGYPLGTEHPELLKMKGDLQHSGSIINGESRIGYMKGGKSALWVDEEFPTVMLAKAKSFIEANKQNPFFLYFALPNIHVPRMPNQKFVGESTMGRRGDDIAEMDWCTGQLIKVLNDLGLSENTLVIFSSDNGPILDDGYDDKAVELLGDHKPEGVYRGSKYSVYEAGTRVPTIVYWPGHVKSGVSNALLSQVDLYASLAKLVGLKVKSGDAPDSNDLLDTWLGKSQKGRDIMLEEAYTFGLRMNDWKYIAPVENTPPDWLKNKDIESGLKNEAQLYNLKTDVVESKNVAQENPGVLKEMEKTLEEIKNQ